MTRLLIAAALGIVCLAACKKSDNGNASQTSVITGINMRDINAQPVGPMGTPNVQTSLNNSQILCYPNPCTDRLMVACKGNPGAAIKVWLVAAIYNNPPASIPYPAATIKVENQSLYGQANPLVVETGTIVDSNFKTIALSVDSLPSGFYRLYTTVGTDTLYDNICRQGQ